VKRSKAFTCAKTVILNLLIRPSAQKDSRHFHPAVLIQRGAIQTCCAKEDELSFALYTQTVPMGVFTASNNDQHTTDLAMLQGARLVTASETEERAALG
jgi:hypothetical protein